jgi:DNA polymerase-1
MEIKYIDKVEDLRVAMNEVSQAPVIGWDCETTGFDPQREKLRTMQFSTHPDKAYVVDTQALRDPLLYGSFIDAVANPNQVVIAQNGKFDLQFLTVFAEQGPLEVESLYDTMIASKLIARGDPDVRHSLGALAKRELDFSGPLSEVQIQYAARDAAILLPIREAQISKAQSFRLEKVLRLEFDAVAGMADVELNGFYLDEEDWMRRIQRQQETAAELRSKILKIVAPHCMQVDLFGDPVLNVDSHTQMLPLLKALGVPAIATSEPELRQFKNSYHIVKLFLDYREASTAVSKFGPDYLHFISDVDDRIHADFQQITAPSGRGSCRKPNLQQVPREEEYRHSFKAQHGGKLITADWSQIELRIMAKQSRDPNLVKVYMEDRDVHSMTAHLVFGVPYDNPGDKRTLSKNLNFGATYGAGPDRFAELAEVRREVAEQALKGFWNAYKVLDGYMRRQGQLCADTGYAYTYSGRTLKIEVDPMDRQAYSSAQRLGRNFGVQGTGADALKRAIYLVRKAAMEQGLDCRVVNLVHDELVVETNDDPEAVAKIVHDGMMQAGEEILEDIPCKVGIKIGDTWQK